MTTAVACELLTRPEAAEYLRLKVQSLAAMACAGRGPCYIKAGRSVRYGRTDLDAWLEKNTVTPASANQ